MSNPIPPQVSLRAMRELLDLTLDQLAERIREQGFEISTSGLNNCEIGHRQPSEQLMVAWSVALGIRRHQVRTGRQLREWLNATVADERALVNAA